MKKRFWWIRRATGLAVLPVFLLSTALTAHEQYRVFVGPVTPFAPGSSEGPTRYEYVTNFSRRECFGIVPTSREDLADFTAWFEFDGRHHVLLWDARGNLIYAHGGVRSSGNIVKDVCNKIRTVPR